MGTFWAGALVAKCSSTAWNPLRNCWKFSGPMVTASTVPTAESTE